MEKDKIQKIIGIVIALAGIIFFFGSYYLYTIGYFFPIPSPIISIGLLCIGVFIYEKAKKKSIQKI